MSLMRLLSAGKTLVSGGEPSGRYRINTGYHLPKFASTKNPFKKPAEEKPAEQVEMQMPAPIQKEAGQIRLSPAELAAAELKETQQMPETGIVPAPQQKVHPILAMLDWMDDTAVRIKERIMRMDLKKLIPKRKRVATSSAFAKSAAGPAQPELSLEKVRVVRNDLSDADLEIVTAKSQVKVELKPQPRVSRSRAPQVEITEPETAPELIGVAE